MQEGVKFININGIPIFYVNYRSDPGKFFSSNILRKSPDLLGLFY